MPHNHRSQRKKWWNWVVWNARQRGDKRPRAIIVREVEDRKLTIDLAFDEAFQDSEIGETVSLHTYSSVDIGRGDVLIMRDRGYVHPVLKVI